jgi:hypothetical protein
MLTEKELLKLEEARKAMLRGEKWLEHVDEDDVVWLKVLNEVLKFTNAHV